MTILEPDYHWNGELEKREATVRIILHHAAVDGYGPEDIHRVHQSGNGWVGIGYNYYIRKDGRVYRGRPEDCVGAHTYGYNETSIGVCFEGNFEVQTMPEVQFEAGAALLRDILRRYPGLEIGAHRDYDATACPGANFPLARMKKEAKEESMDYEQFCEYMRQYEAEQRAESVSDWAAASWQKASAKGITDGTMPRRPMTREQMVTILDRLGMLE